MMQRFSINNTLAVTITRRCLSPENLVEVDKQGGGKIKVTKVDLYFFFFKEKGVERIFALFAIVKIIKVNSKPLLGVVDGC